MLLQKLVEWLPRTGYVEADALANGDHRAFDPAHRVHADLRSLIWDASTSIGCRFSRGT